MPNAPSGAFALDPDHVGLTVAPEPRCKGQGVASIVPPTLGSGMSSAGGFLRV
jgi:hypothetical protein